MSEDLPRYQALSGPISQLRTEATRVNYLDGLRQARQPETGSSADEADLVHGCTMEVAGTVGHGSFWQATFREGGHVQVVGKPDHGTGVRSIVAASGNA